jgi:hypothetical protein
LKYTALNIIYTIYPQEVMIYGFLAFMVSWLLSLPCGNPDRGKDGWATAPGMALEKVAR